MKKMLENKKTFWQTDLFFKILAVVIIGLVTLLISIISKQFYGGG